MRQPGRGGNDPAAARSSSGFLAFNQRLIDGGHWVTGGGLPPLPSATTARLAAATVPKVLDGPYAETKEQLCGFYLVTANSLDDVLRPARELPIEGATRSGHWPPVGR